MKLTCYFMRKLGHISGAHMLSVWRMKLAHWPCSFNHCKAARCNSQRFPFTPRISVSSRMVGMHAMPSAYQSWASCWGSMMVLIEEDGCFCGGVLCCVEDAAADGAQAHHLLNHRIFQSGLTGSFLELPSSAGHCLSDCTMRHK